ncbi:unnamed protein product, partial [Didymodactylos carnosus]
DENITSENAGDIVHLRVERQTLRRLPKSKDILFTIKTYLTPMAEIVKDVDVAKRLASAIRNWPPEVIHYKSAKSYKDPLLKYLDKVTDAKL